MRGWVRILFIISVALNLLVAGIVVGGFFAHDRHGPQPKFDPVGGPLGAAFSEKDRDAMRREAQAEGADLPALRGRFHEDVAQLVTLLEAEPWDPEAVQAQLREMRSRGMARADLGEKVMVAHLGQMSADDRRAYAERLRERLLSFRKNGPGPRDK